MYPTEEQIKRHNEEAEEENISSTALILIRGLWDYSSFVKSVNGDNIYKQRVDKMIRHYLSLPQYKHLPKPKGFEM